MHLLALAAARLRPGVLVLTILGLTACPLWAQNVLVWSTGNSGGSTPGVAAWLQASGQFTSVTGVDTTSMSLATLLSYDRVLFFTNTNAGDQTANGNMLADYSDTGRRLVIATFAWANQGANTLGGRIIADEISPLVLDGSSIYADADIDTTDGSDFWTGVNAVTGYFRDNTTLTSGATLRGTWTDGQPMLATKANVVGVTLFPDDSWGSVSGDNRQLFVNSLTAGIPEPTSLTAVAAICLFLPRRRAARV